MNFKDFKKIIEEDIKTKESELRKFIFSQLSKLPIPSVKVNSDTFIERAVKISKSEKELDLSRLSYIPKKLKHITPKGRFNQAKDPHFYGTFTDFNNPETTRYYLATEIDQKILGKQTDEFNFTVGKWLSTNEFPAILFIFKSEFCHNDLIRPVYDSYIKSKEYKQLTIEQKLFLETLTLELSKLKSANGYEITNIVFEYYKSKGFQSMIYPGIPGSYRGNNIVMTPDIFDKNFTFFMAAEFCLSQKDNDINISHVVERIKV